MPKGSAELTNARKEEIIAACRELYENRSFKDITLKEIGQRTSFTRTSIYNYYETKEEIFLALLQKEYTADYLTKKRCKNHGQLPMYYVKGNHEPIIPPPVFDAVQRELERRRCKGK